LRPDSPQRCSVVSRALGEPLAGTASTVRGWLLLEQPGPWGAEALAGSRLADGLGPALTGLSERTGLRVLLVRRHGRGASTVHRSCFVAYTGPGEPWLEHVRLDDPRRVLDLDLEGVVRGVRPGLRPMPGPVFLVCTHGRHDRCCAERGRPLAGVLSHAYRAQTWESSHIGGDRFAGNLVCFPHGLYFGRVRPEDALAVASAYARGAISLPHYRGRSAYGFAVQAAECYLRAADGLTGVDDVRLAGGYRDGDEVRVTFGVPGGEEVLVRLRVRRADPARMISCGHRPERPPAYDLLALERN
jgi:Sucrase/ferredoxin-like